MQPEGKQDGKIQGRDRTTTAHRRNSSTYAESASLCWPARIHGTIRKDGRVYCNAGYRCLSVQAGTREGRGTVSRILIADARRVLRALTDGELLAITTNPVYMHPGRYGANSDPSGSCNALERGWGANLQCFYAQGT